MDMESEIFIEGQVVSTVGSLMDPYLGARMYLLMEMNRRWAELEQAFAEHQCDILDVEPGQGRSLITGEPYLTFCLKSKTQVPVGRI